MDTGAGRVEKRVHLEMPVQISRVHSLGLTDHIEKTTTENVSSRGVRVLTRRALQPREWLWVTSVVGGEMPKPAQVVYCQPVAGELFGVGLQFQEGKKAA
jgi:PilZ domain